MSIIQLMLIAVTAIIACAESGNILPRTVVLPEHGITIEYATHGSYTTDDHVPVICLHGYTDAWYSYYLLMQNTRNVKIYAISLPCYGSSTKDATIASSYDSLAGVVIEFMDVIGIDQAVFMGHSMSSLLAPHVAYLYPERASGVFLVGPRAEFITDPSMMSREGTDPNMWGFFPWVEWIISSNGMGPDDVFDHQFCEEWQLSTVYKEIPAFFLEGCVQETMKVPAKCWQAGINAMSSVDFTETLTTLNLPFMIVYGDHEMFPWDEELGGQESLIKHVPSIAIVKLEGIGHASHWEAPVTIGVILTEFMKKI
jgi:non-heme chloroperoxidase